MDKINRKKVTDFPKLEKLAKNWEQWGKEYAKYRATNGEEGINFSWRGGIYKDLRANLANLTKGHCAFCDGNSFDASKETIEHFKPKNEFPLLAYQYENLFYCCDKCQSNSNKPYQPNIKPDHENYDFASIFYIDLKTFQIEVLEHLESDNPDLFTKAKAFLNRYGINGTYRISRRKNVYKDLQNYFIAEYGTADTRNRDNFQYRYLFDELFSNRAIKSKKDK